MRYRMSIALMILSVALVGASADQSDSDVASVKAFNQAYEKAERASDVNTMANLWAGDGVMLPPGESAVTGSRQIHAWLERNRPDTTKVRISNNSYNWKDITVAGDYAFQWAPTFFEIQSAEGDAGAHISGTALEVLKKQPDGSWKLYRASWSTQAKRKTKGGS
jgi:uncharacterized protein (TIGR02246 family)